MAKDDEELEVLASFQVGGTASGGMVYTCGETRVGVLRDGTVVSLNVCGISGGHQGYRELAALIEGIIKYERKEV